MARGMSVKISVTNDPVFGKDSMEITSPELSYIIGRFSPNYTYVVYGATKWIQHEHLMWRLV